jgi:hypothetical protein
MAFGNIGLFVVKKSGKLGWAGHVAQVRENKIHTTLHLKILNGRNNPW